MMKKYNQNRLAQLLLSGWLLLLLAAPRAGFSQCNNDQTPPTPVCQTIVHRDVLNNNAITVTAQEFDNGSTDDCAPPAALSFFIEAGTPSPTPPGTTSLEFNSTQTGSHPIVLWVVDTAGNAAYCTTTLELRLCFSSVACNDQVTIQLDANNMGSFSAADGLAVQACSFHSTLVRLDPFSGGAPAAPSIALDASHIGQRIFQVTVLPAGVSCWGTVTILGTPCNNDDTPPTAVCDENVLVTVDTNKTPAGWLLPWMLDDGSYDNCTTPANLDFRLQRFSDYTGTPPAETALPLSADDFGLQTFVLWVGDEADLWTPCLTDVDLYQVEVHLIRGKVFADENADCAFQTGDETGLAGWQVVATAQSSGEQFTALTDAQGNYRMSVDSLETNFQVALTAPFNYGGTCGTTYTVNFPTQGSPDTVALDIPVALNPDCPLLFVDLATPKIRPCFPGVYYVQYANASAFAVDDTYVDVTLDPALSYQGSTLPATDLGNQLYRFETGTLAPGESGLIGILFAVDCDAPIGATHCTEAHIFPDTICPPAAGWSGANIEVHGTCANDSIFLEIKNTGTGPTQTLDFIVVEDVLMRQSGQFNLGPGASYALDPIAGTGPTFRLEAGQEPGHPYGGAPAVAVEGCGGFTPGMVTLFATNNSNPFIAVDCRENTSSFDPNDKQALPKGYAAGHLIERNVPLQYTIRFQNTGTDTAFRVVVLDTLTSQLAGATARPGVASHPYRFELLGGNVLRFTFDNILLPDSNVNVAASQGFVQFQVEQTPDLPDGARIENNADIYFDFNAPVRTNTVFHTVGDHFILVSTDPGAENAAALRVYPNPATDRVTFDLPDLPGAAVQFVLTDAQGRTVFERRNTALPLTLERAGLKAGVYFFRMNDLAGRSLGAGKLTIR